MEDLPEDMLLEIAKYLNGELTFINRKSYNAYKRLADLKINSLDVSTRNLLLGNTIVEKYNHYLSTKTYTRLTPKYRRGLSLLRSIVNSDTYYDLGDLITIVDEAYKRMVYLSDELRSNLDLDEIYRYLGFNYDLKDLRVLEITDILLPYVSRQTGSEYNHHFHLYAFSMARRDFYYFINETYFYDVQEGRPIYDKKDFRVLFDVYRYQHETNVRRFMEYYHINDIPSIVGERWSYMYSGYYGDVNQAKTLVKGKYAQLLLDYALIGNQPDIVRLCVREGVNVSRYFDLRPSLVLELKPPNWEFYAIETGDLDVIAKTLESPNSLTINKAFGHVDVVEAMSKQ